MIPDSDEDESEEDVAKAETLEDTSDDDIEPEEEK